MSASATKAFDRGDLLYPSKAFFQLVQALENIIAKYFCSNEVHADMLQEIINSVHEANGRPGVAPMPS